MKRITSVIALCYLMGMVAPAGADICHVEPMPAATLLLPYFEVDTSNQNGANTLVSVNNAFATPVLVKAEVWTNLGVPVFGFNIYLNGHDVQTISLYDVLVNGILPQTAPPAGTFTSCNGVLPPPTIPGSTLFNYQRALLGLGSAMFNYKCAGVNMGDYVARGYITFDTVNNCSLRYQGDIGYFVSGGMGDATNQNALWGDYFYVNSTTNLADGATLVHIRASSSDPATSVADQYTFYGKFVSWTAVDNREPLATNFAARFANGGGFSGGTDLFVWRDSKVAQGAFTCGTQPAWYPLGQQHAIAYDEQSNSSILGGTPFPAVAQRVHVGSGALPVPYTFGWLYLDLNDMVAAAGSNPPVDPLADQAWVTVMWNANGRFGLGFDAPRYDSACKAQHTLP